MDEPYNTNRDFKSEVEAYKIENDNLKREYGKQWFHVTYYML